MNRKERNVIRMALLVGAFAGSVGCAHGPAPAVETETVGQLSASYHSIAVAPVHHDAPPQLGFVAGSDDDEVSSTVSTVTRAADTEAPAVVGPSGPPWLHDLRRSFITLARRRGEETTNIMAASGHKTMAAFQRYNIHARKDALLVRDRVEAARAHELAALEERRGPQRSPEKIVAVDKVQNNQ